jgi:hypothetical protein
MGNDDSAATRAPTIHDPEGVHLHNCSALYDDLVRAVAVAVYHKLERMRWLLQQHLHWLLRLTLDVCLSSKSTSSLLNLRYSLLLCTHVRRDGSRTCMAESAIICCSSTPWKPHPLTCQLLLSCVHIATHICC